VAGDLSSIEGLADKHVRALNRRHVTGLRELARADPEVIYRAMASLWLRPTRAQVAHWQDDARCQLEGTAPVLAEWQTAASFVVVFCQRRTGGIWERRIEAERTEVEPERAMEVWSGWQAAPVWAWMADQLGQANGAGGPPAPAAPPGEEATGIPWPWPGRGRPSSTRRRSRRSTTR
jgi:hypothetical protein